MPTNISEARITLIDLKKRFEEREQLRKEEEEAIEHIKSKIETAE